jgi:hypothetical protein
MVRLAEAGALPAINLGSALDYVACRNEFNLTVTGMTQALLDIRPATALSLLLDGYMRLE